MLQSVCRYGGRQERIPSLLRCSRINRVITRRVRSWPPSTLCTQLCPCLHQYPRAPCSIVTQKKTSRQSAHFHRSSCRIDKDTVTATLAWWASIVYFCSHVLNVHAQCSAFTRAGVLPSIRSKSFQSPLSRICHSKSSFEKLNSEMNM